MYRLIVFLALFTLQVFAQESGQLRKVDVVTEDLPPYQIRYKDNSIKGIITDKVRTLFLRANLKANIQMMPWARAYKTSLDVKDTFIYSITRTPEREDKFQWIGVLVSAETNFVRLSSRKDITINELADSARYLIGVKRDDVTTNYLKRKVGIKNLVFLHDTKTTLRMLVKERVDVITVSQVHLEYLCQHLGYEISNFTTIFQLADLGNDFYLAANKDTSPVIVKKLREELAALNSAN